MTRLRAAFLYAGFITPALMASLGGGSAMAGQLGTSAFQAYNPANAGSIVPGAFSLYTTSINNVLPTQMNEGYTEVARKAAGYDLITASQLPANLIGYIEPVVIGPGGKLYLTDGHHTFTAVLDSYLGTTNPTVYVNVIANYSNLTTAQFFAQMEANNFLLPLNNGVPQIVDNATGAPIPTSLTGLNNDPYRGLEYSLLKNKNSKLFTTTANITGAIGSSTPGLDKMTGFYMDFLEAAAYRNANGGLGLPYLSPGDIALATQWNLTGTNQTTLPNVTGMVSVAQLPGFILSQNIVNAGGISNATLATGALDGNGTFTGITQINAGTASNPIIIGTPNTGLIMQLGADKKFSVTLNGTNTYTGGTQLAAGTLVVQSDASLGAATPVGATIDPANVKSSVQAANGIIFNGLTEGNPTLTLGTNTTPGTFATNRPIAVDGEVATVNLNNNTVTLTGQLVSLGTNGVGLGNTTGNSDITFDDLSAAGTGKVILSTASPYFYGNIIVGNSGTPTVTAMSDAALGNTTGPAASIGQVELNGGTFQVGANITAPERNFFLGGGSQLDVNGFTSSWGTLSDTQRSLQVLNSNATTAGAITFNNLLISATAILQLTGGAAGESVTFTNGIARTANDTLILDPTSATSLGTTEKLFNGAGAASLVNGIAPAWIVTNNGVSTKGAGPYDFVTYGANGYVKATYTGTTLTGSTNTSVVSLAANQTLTGNAAAFALNTAGKTIALGSDTLTLGDGTNPAGLILAAGSAVTTTTGGKLAFGGSEGVISLGGATPTTSNYSTASVVPVISGQITGSNGLTFAGSGGVNIAAAAAVTGPITIDSGTVVLSAANVFAGDVSGVNMANNKTKPSPAVLDIAANNTLTSLNTVGNNSTLNLLAGAALTLGDTTNNQSSTVNATVTQTGAAAAGALTFNGSGLFDFSGGKITLVAGSSIIANNSAQFRVAASEFNTTANYGIILNGTSQLQFAQNGGGVLGPNITVSGTGALHLIGGTLQITGPANTYSGGTIVETGSILDVTTANLPTVNQNITDAGGLIVFDQATTGTYTGVISDGLEMGTGPLMQGTLVKDDSTGTNSGNVTISQPQTYTGGTFVEAGTLTLGGANVIATSSGVDLGRVGGGATAVLALGANNTIKGLTNEQNNTTSVALGGNTLTINTAAATTTSFSGSIGGTGGVVIGGTGTQALTGTESYTGGTTVNSGATLTLTGSLASGLTNSGTANVQGSIAGAITNNTNSSLNVTGALTGVTGITNSGTLTLGTTGTNTLTIGSYTGNAGSQIAAGVNFTTGTADKLVVTSVSGSSQFVITDVNPGSAGSYNPTGIALVTSANPMNPSSFTLAGGSIQKGLFNYVLAYNPDPGFFLVGTPSADIYRLATLGTAAQTIWQDTAAIDLDHATDMRDYLLGKGDASRYDVSTGQGLWARVLGQWSNRSQSQTYQTIGVSTSLPTSYALQTDAVFGGIDLGRESVISAGDTYLFGGSAGYINANQTFRGSATTAGYQGASFALTSNYVNQHVFVDTVLKADILQLSLGMPSVLGGSKLGSTFATIGGIVDAGYRFDLDQKTFLEPFVTIAYAKSNLGSLSMAGTQTTFGNNETLRGRLGARFGGTVADTPVFRIDASATASVWDRIAGSANATVNSGAASPLLAISDTPVNAYGDVGAKVNFSSQKTGWSGFLQSDLLVGSNYTSGAFKAGVGYRF